MTVTRGRLITHLCKYLWHSSVQKVFSSQKFKWFDDVLLIGFHEWLTGVELLFDLPPLSDVVDWDDSGTDEEHQTGNHSEDKWDQFPVPNHLIFLQNRSLSWKGLDARRRMMPRCSFCCHRFRPIDFNGVEGFADGVHMRLTRPLDDLMLAALAALDAITHFHVQILVTFACRWG